MATRWHSTSRSRHPAAVDVPGSMPSAIEPELATLVGQPPAHGEWLYEIKFDGYRVMVRKSGDVVQLLTRNGHDWTDRLPRLRDSLQALPGDAWMDGEAVVLGLNGQPDFNALQNAFDRRSTANIILFVFDLLWIGDSDLREQPLRERRRLLSRLLESVDSPLVRFSQDFDQEPRSLLASACKMKLEGIIGKRADSPYRSGRSNDWIKLKCNLRQEFVVGGYSRAKGARSGLHALLLGVFEDDGTLRYAGSVRPTLSTTRTNAFAARAADISQHKAPFRNPPQPESDREFIWLAPEIVAEVAFLEWTKGGEIRHPVFHAIREDKPARAVTREAVQVADSIQSDSTSDPAKRKRGAPVLSGVKISNPDRVMDPSTGLTKLDVVRYYDAIAEWALPHLRARPLALVRAPEGIGGELFFQKHSERARIPGIQQLPPELNPRHPPLLVSNTVEALVGLAQMGVIELHTWNASAPDLEHPDRIIFDLDPDPALPWSAMLEAAALLRVVLDELGLRSFPKTSGGKGFHVVVPLTRRHSWDEAKQFSQAVAQHMARVVPDRFSAVLGPKNRVGKIFIDYLRNGRGASTVAPFSVRARPGLAVSMPVSWVELADIKRGDQFSMAAAASREQARRGDPWANYWRTRQGITTAMRRAVGMR
ncbi:DNA ligase D [Paraburkholderia rhizosphaerae]|uniref:DNA ligase (ATP) n=1 Tax=Paraburkholderia rhizosphaerae TaxID=480658 RepID=A0A4V6QD26_9BURK|nr:DNA ligase D [Paraburkholderia rhizosphaerae]TDY48099.1 bifunctional non-homologous end joining protein LigD [Paraburkholderia rhizosphaerae]